MKPGYRYRIYLLLICSFFFTCAHATGESGRLTVNDLVEQGYQHLGHDTLVKIFQMRAIAVTDIETGEIFILESGAEQAEKKGKLEKIHDARPEKMFSLDSMARAPMLKNATYTIVGDAIIATDGVRNHRISFYKKGDTVYSVRDVDAGYVYYQLSKVKETYKTLQ
jgi:hypothetical protein